MFQLLIDQNHDHQLYKDQNKILRTSPIRRGFLLYGYLLGKNITMGQRLILSEEEKLNIQEMYGLISEQSSNVNASNVNDLLKDLENFEVEDEQLTGCVEGDCENGKGRYVYSDGSVYEGEFKNGKKDGRGVYTYGSKSINDGSVYKGYFTQGKKNGFGKFTHKKGWSMGS